MISVCVSRGRRGEKLKKDLVCKHFTEQIMSEGWVPIYCQESQLYNRDLKSSPHTLYKMCFQDITSKPNSETSVNSLFCVPPHKTKLRRAVFSTCYKDLLMLNLKIYSHNKFLHSYAQLPSKNEFPQYLSLYKKQFVDIPSIQSLKKSKKHQVVRCFKITFNRKKKRFKVVLQFQK